jgi:hypothetical protein
MEPFMPLISSFTATSEAVMSAGVGRRGRLMPGIHGRGCRMPHRHDFAGQDEERESLLKYLYVSHLVPPLGGTLSSTFS